MEKLQENVQLLLNLFKSGQFYKAETFNKELIKKNPNNIFFYNFMAIVLTQQQKIDEAILFCKSGIKIDQKHAPIYDNLGTAYKIKGDYLESEKAYKKSIELDNSLAEAQNNLGNLYIMLNRFNESIECFKKAILINSKQFTYHYNLGIVYKTIGRFSESLSSFNESIALNNNFCTAHRSLSGLIKYKKNDKHLEIMKTLKTKTYIQDDQKTELLFALAKAYDDINDFDQAFKYYTEANLLRRKKINFSIKDEKLFFNNIKSTFSKKLINKMVDAGNKSFTPIFIIGMPRSGTTLAEQIISSHSDVFGGDELTYMSDVVEKYILKGKDKNLLNVKQFTKNDFYNIGNEYIKKIKKLSPNSKMITDKMPINFKWLGLIKIIFPKSKIIHCTRNSKDNCVSIFKNYFTNTKLNYAYDLKEICDFYNLYLDLMCYWKKNIPNFIFDFNYENIVNKSEKQIKNLVKNCELEWEEDCLKFYENNRPVKTTSETQVRKKIYKTSINSWKNYKKNLKNTLSRLKK